MFVDELHEQGGVGRAKAGHQDAQTDGKAAGPVTAWLLDRGLCLRDQITKLDTTCKHIQRLLAHVRGTECMGHSLLSTCFVRNNPLASIGSPPTASDHTTLSYDQYQSSLQASFTAKELRELLRLEGVRIVIDPQQMQATAADEAEMKASRAKKRIFDIMRGAVDAPSNA